MRLACPLTGLFEHVNSWQLCLRKEGSLMLHVGVTESLAYKTLLQWWGSSRWVWDGWVSDGSIYTDRQTDTDGYCRKQKEDSEWGGRPSSGFSLCFVEQCCISPADGGPEPRVQLSSTADNNMCCLQGENTQHNKSNHLLNCPLKSQLVHLAGRRAVCVRGSWGENLPSKNNFQPHNISKRVITGFFYYIPVPTFTVCPQSFKKII